MERSKDELERLLKGEDLPDATQEQVPGILRALAAGYPEIEVAESLGVDHLQMISLLSNPDNESLFADAKRASIESINSQQIKVAGQLINDQLDEQQARVAMTAFKEFAGTRREATEGGAHSESLIPITLSAIPITRSFPEPININDYQHVTEKDE